MQGTQSLKINGIIMQVKKLSNATIKEIYASEDLCRTNVGNKDYTDYMQEILCELSVRKERFASKLSASLNDSKHPTYININRDDKSFIRLVGNFVCVLRESFIKDYYHYTVYPSCPYTNKNIRHVLRSDMPSAMPIDEIIASLVDIV